jgi:hypothetical protein
MEFEDLLKTWESQGVFNVLMPFFLVFAIVFAMLQTTKVLGGKKNIDLVIGLVAGLIFVSNQTLVKKLNDFLPTVSLLVLAGLLILILLGLFSKSGKISPLWFGLIFVVVLIIFVLNLGGNKDIFSQNFFYSVDWTWVAIILIIIFLIISFMKSKGKKENKKT